MPEPQEMDVVGLAQTRSESLHPLLERPLAGQDQVSTGQGPGAVALAARSTAPAVTSPAAAPSGALPAAQASAPGSRSRENAEIASAWRLPDENSATISSILASGGIPISALTASASPTPILFREYM